MIIFGNKNYQKLLKSLAIPGVAICSIKYWFLPIYRVSIKYTD